MVALANSSSLREPTKGTEARTVGDMTTTVKAVISRAKNEPVELTDIVIPDPGDNDVIVRIQACGVCHTDLAYLCLLYTSDAADE